MKVHLRLTEKDVDLCRWRHSVKKRMFTYYVSQILLSEMRWGDSVSPHRLKCFCEERALRGVYEFHG